MIQKFLLTIVGSVALATGVHAQMLSISEVYGGGGNTSATYVNDFIELYNGGTAPIDLMGYSVQYASATGTAYQITPIATASFVLGVGQFYLIQEASTANVGAANPTPNATGTINLSATNGKVALANNVTAVTTGGTAGAFTFSANVVDYVGYGTANVYQGTGAAPAGSNILSVQRPSPYTNTGSNSADFLAATPNPTAVPEPSTYSIGGISLFLLGLALYARRRLA